MHTFPMEGHMIVKLRWPKHNISFSVLTIYMLMHLMLLLYELNLQYERISSEELRLEDLLRRLLLFIYILFNQFTLNGCHYAVQLIICVSNVHINCI